MGVTGIVNVAVLLPSFVSGTTSLTSTMTRREWFPPLALGIVTATTVEAPAPRGPAVRSARKFDPSRNRTRKVPAPPVAGGWFRIVTLTTTSSPCRGVTPCAEVHVAPVATRSGRGRVRPASRSVTSLRFEAVSMIG